MGQLCEVYGAPSLLPTPEPAPYAPANPYAVSKAAGEMLADVFARSHGLRVTCARPYSHAGPRQRPMYVLSNLARQGAARHVVDPARVRASEAMELRGDHAKLTAATEWRPPDPVRADDGRHDRVVGPRAGAELACPSPSVADAPIAFDVMRPLGGITSNSGSCR